MKRVFLIVLDSFGIGAMPDAAEYGDEGVNTLGTVAANVGIGEGALGTSQTFNFYDTQTSPDAIRRKVQNTMTFGLAGGI